MTLTEAKTQRTYIDSEVYCRRILYKYQPPRKLLRIETATMDSPPQATQASSVDTTAYVLPPHYDAQMKVLHTRIAELKTLLDKFTSSFRSSTSTTGILLPHGLQKRLVETIPTILGSLQLEVKAFSQRVRYASLFHDSDRFI